MIHVLASLALATALSQAAPEGSAVHHESEAPHVVESNGPEHRSMEHEPREATFSEALLGHVTDGYVVEYPGYCDGGFSANCEWNLKHTFGNALVIGKVDLTPTKHTVMMWLASLVLLLVFLPAVRRRGLVPTGVYNFLEVLVQFVRQEIAINNMGKENADRFVPFLCTAFFFILFLNIFGLVPWAATATGNLSVTVCLAAFTFLITQWAAIRAQGLGGWLKHLTGGVHFLLWPIMIPVEVLGLFTKPFALTMRLFANMVAGHIVILSLLGLIIAFHSPLVAVGSVPMALAIFLLEIFVAFVQAYIFTMLSALFIGQGLVQHGHGEAHGEGHGHGAADGGDHGSHVAGKVPSHG
jgi:F-type H+-transporting ATPase subunit a